MIDDVKNEETLDDIYHDDGQKCLLTIQGIRKRHRREFPALKES